MGRPRNTARVDEIDTAPRDERDLDREEDRDDFENQMFTENVESPFHVPNTEWGDGMIMRWISIEVTGSPDNKNWSLKTAAKWTPVPRGKYRKIDARFPTVPMPGMGDNYAGLIVYGGLCLCERDIRLSLHDKKRQEKDTRDAARTVETYIEGGNPNFPRKDFGSSPVQYERARGPVQFKE